MLKNKIIFLKSECGDIDHKDVPIDKLCMVIDSPVEIYKFIRGESLFIKIQKTIGTGVSESYAHVDDIVIFKPEYQSGDSLLF